MSTSKDRRDFVTVDEAAEAVAKAFGEFTRVVNTIPSYADEIAAAFAKEGEAGVRKAMERMARELRERTEAVTAEAIKGIGEGEADPAAKFPGKQ